LLAEALEERLRIGVGDVAGNQIDFGAVADFQIGLGLGECGRVSRGEDQRAAVRRIGVGQGDADVGAGADDQDGIG